MNREELFALLAEYGAEVYAAAKEGREKELHRLTEGATDEVLALMKKASRGFARS